MPQRAVDDYIAIIVGDHNIICFTKFSRRYFASLIPPIPMACNWRISAVSAVLRVSAEFPPSAGHFPHHMLVFSAWRPPCFQHFSRHSVVVFAPSSWELVIGSSRRNALTRLRPRVTVQSDLSAPARSTFVDKLARFCNHRGNVESACSPASLQ